MLTAIHRCFAACDIEGWPRRAGVMGATPHSRRKQCRSSTWGVHGRDVSTAVRFYGLNTMLAVRRNVRNNCIFEGPKAAGGTSTV